jgi:FtsP/CotA-like multicopper oxidase with cupredoxin domain
MNRRQLLRSVAIIAATGPAIWPSLSLAENMQMHGMAMTSMKMGGGMMGGGERIAELPVGQPLPELAKLINTSKQPGIFEAVIEAGPSQVEFVKGIKTEVLAYNGAVPGPMIEVMEGDKFKLTFRNKIVDQDSTIHWHGLDIPPDQDGNPSDPVASGQEHVYEFDIPEGSAGSYWYHPHPHGHTAEQVYRGLAGAFIVRAKNDPLPRELGDTVLIISSISLNTDGSVAENTMMDLMNGREGDHVLVNGAKQPVLNIAPGSSRRFRLYNATNGRFLKLSLNGHDMTLVGTDGGLLAAPVPGMKDILLAPAERAEIIVDFKNTEGKVTLVSLPYERGWMGGDAPAAESISLITFNLGGKVGAKTTLPTQLRVIADLGVPKATKHIELSETMGMASGMMSMGFLIDSKSFDMSRIDLTSVVGDVELWEIVNTTTMDHPFHIHGGQFQIIERERKGNRIAAPFLSWKDTVNIVQGETVRVKMRQARAGLRMYHCHILEHEDAGMMGTLRVV